MFATASAFAVEYECRALLVTGSRYDGLALKWLRDRHSTIVSVGPSVPGAAYAVGYPSDTGPLVRLLTEPRIGEPVAQAWGPR